MLCARRSPNRAWRCCASGHRPTRSRKGSVVLADVAERPLVDVTVTNLVLHVERLAESLLHQPGPLAGVLPALEADRLHYLVDVVHDPLDHDRRVGVLQRLEEFGE